MKSIQKKYFYSHASLFLIGEYKFRHIIQSEDNIKAVRNVAYIKRILQYYFDESYTDRLSDAMLLYHAFYCSKSLTGLPAACF